PVNPRMIFDEIELIFHERMAGKGLSYITDIDDSLPDLLLLDETRLRQILLNLFGNAVKFTETGHIKLTAKQGAQSDQPGLSAGTPGQINLVISVEDTGIGIPVEEQAIIFQPFKQQFGQSIRKYGGTGLGLSISRRLTHMMKGRISVESQPGKGSTFNILLENVAVASAGETAAPGESFNPGSISFETGRILVVDDVESNRHLLQEILTRVHLEVLTAGSGPEGLRMAEESLPDVIIMDIAMPVMDGFQTTKALKRNPKTKDIPVLVLSASSTLEQKEKIMASGFFTAYLTKPVNVAELFNELSNVLPYSQTQEPTPTSADNQSHFKELPEKTLIRLPQLVRILREEMLPALEDLKGALNMEEVKKFAHQVKQLGEDFAVPGLTDYANRLDEFEQSFDVTGVKNSLADFPARVDALILQAEEYNERQ
ncbi:MAG: response regulator, partial [bacterium]|nr:response regulator [bacterium]